MPSCRALLVLGNQLFPVSGVEKLCEKRGISHVFMREDAELCTYYRFHKHKIIFFLAAMRTYAEELKAKGLKVHHEELDGKGKKYEEQLLLYLKKNKISELSLFEIEDKFFEKRILEILAKNSIQVEVIASPMFLTSRKDFASYLGEVKKPFMNTFYQRQRKALKILVSENGEPEGGRWSFDSENRKPLPEKIQPPPLPRVKRSKIVEEVKEACNDFFPSHPGKAENFWLPVDRAGAIAWLNNFLETRFPHFGPYEDALAVHSDFVFHSVLTPFLNTGLLTPREVVQKTIAFAKEKKVPIESVEGFLRQIIGWREFIRGIYQNYSQEQESKNFWKAEKKLSSVWYEGNSGIPPLDNMIRKANEFAYTHHIERLMVAGSLMLLLEVHPKEAHRWFMEMFLDSSDWVMGPNVYGMALFSDGGIFATKPYICGSNYYRKMGPFKKDSWCDGVDGLYWGFVQKHRAFFSKNPRLGMMVKTLDKMTNEKKSTIFAAAEDLRHKLLK